MSAKSNAVTLAIVLSCSSCSSPEVRTRDNEVAAVRCSEHSARVIGPECWPHDLSPPTLLLQIGAISNECEQVTLGDNDACALAAAISANREVRVTATIGILSRDPADIERAERNVMSARPRAVFGVSGEVKIAHADATDLYCYSRNGSDIVLTRRKRIVVDDKIDMRELEEFLRSRD